MKIVFYSSGEKKKCMSSLWTEARKKFILHWHCIASHRYQLRYHTCFNGLYPEHFEKEKKLRGMPNCDEYIKEEFLGAIV